MTEQERKEFIQELKIEISELRKVNTREVYLPPLIHHIIMELYKIVKVLDEEVENANSN